MDRLDRLRDAGLVDSLQVRVWGDAVRTAGGPSEVAADEGSAGRIASLFSFAADSPCSIGRYFSVVADGSLVDVESRPRLLPPRRCLCVRRRGDLVAVFPCDVGSAHLTPWDALEYLEEGTARRPVADVSGN